MQTLSNNPMPDSKSLLRFIQITLFGSLLLYLGKTVFIPLSFSLLISFILYPVCRWLENRKTPRAAAIIISILLLTLFLSLIIYLLFRQFFGFLSEWPLLKEKLFVSFNELQNWMQARFNISVDSQNKWIDETLSGSSVQFLSAARGFLFSSAVNLVLLILIPILSALILLSRERLVQVLYLLFPAITHSEIRSILRESITAYYNFIKGMGIVYLVVGTLNSIGLALLGIPHPVLFGFIASVLTFIPYAGIIVASLLPISIAWLTYNSVFYPLGVVVIFTVVQYLEANVIFPLAVSNRLNINTLITILVILAGGVIWGAAGMILFIPFVAILKLVADRTESLKLISTLLGTGKVD